MKKLKVEYNDFPSHSEEYGYVEGCAGYMEEKWC